MREGKDSSGGGEQRSLVDRWRRGSQGKGFKRKGRKEVDAAEKERPWVAEPERGRKKETGVGGGK